MYYGFGMGPSFGWIMMIILWILIIWLVFYLIKGAGICPHNHGDHHDDEYRDEVHQHGDKVSEHGEHQPSAKAIELLKERYAKGEISQSEYEERKKVLSA